MKAQPTNTGFEVFETSYKLYKHGCTFPLVVKYEYRKSPEALKVIGVTPKMELTPKEMEEIDLHCWVDRTRVMNLEFLEEEIYPLLGCTPTGEFSCA